uniref:Uncharacterized protein n=1 Tax=Anguilla anguilla TaxID=7936 RepID=A0A0E9U7G5_ANGAN
MCFCRGDEKQKGEMTGVCLKLLSCLCILYFH